MINIEKYLYWLNYDEKTLSKEIVWRELYTGFGYIFHTIQMIEYNIANILAIEEFEEYKKEIFTRRKVEYVKQKIEEKYTSLSTYTFGKLKKEVEKSKYLSNINLGDLGKVIDYRNYLAHRCFKEKLVNKELCILEDVEKFICDLYSYKTIVVELNEYVLDVFKKNKIKPVLMEIEEEI